MGFLKFQNYIFEGEKSNLDNVHDYLKGQFARESGIDWSEDSGCGIEFDNQDGSEILKVHIDSRSYFVSPFKEIAAQKNVSLYYSCGSEMGGCDTNDCDEKYFKWKPENLERYGFRGLAIVQKLKDGTVNKWEDCNRKFWTLESVKERIRHLDGEVYFCLSEGCADIDHSELDELIKNGNASIYDIYTMMDDMLSWCEDQYPEFFAVTNDREGKYFELDKPVIYVDSFKEEKPLPAVGAETDYDDNMEVPF